PTAPPGAPARERARHSQGAAWRPRGGLAVLRQDVPVAGSQNLPGLRSGRGDWHRPRGRDPRRGRGEHPAAGLRDRKSTRLNSSHLGISYAVFCLKKKKNTNTEQKTKQISSNTELSHLNQE